ncbi:MAG TPA: hypothetical protein VIP31_06385 [Acidovorax sp.]
MAKRRNPALDFIQAFNATYDTVNKVGQDYEMSKIANAKPEQGGEFSAEQAAQIQAAADSGQSHIGYDDASKAYVATPKLADDQMGPAQPVVLAKQGVTTNFLGQSTPGAMSESQIANARQRAMAGVVSKYDPVQGSRMMRDVLQGEREDKRWQREDKKATEDEEFQKGLQAEYGNSIFAKKMGEFAPQMQSYQQAQEQYQARLQAGESPQTLGAPPQAPQRPSYTVAESLADNGRLLAFKATKGKADPAELMKYAETFKKVADEGYGQALKLAQSGAPLAKVAEQFNQTGAAKFDPAAVVSDEMVKGADGVASRVIKFKDQAGNVQTINALSELDSIGQAEGYFNRFFKSEDNRRGNNADARANTQLAETMRHNRVSEGISAAGARDRAGERAEAVKKAEAGVALYQETNPDATPAQLEAVRRGILAAVPEAGKNAPSEVKLARAMVDAGLAPDMKTGIEMAVTKKSQSPAEMHKEFVAANIKNFQKPEDAVRGADDVMKSMGYRKAGNTWTNGPEDKAKPAAPAAGPAKGAVVNGFEFLGGDPKKQSSWRQVAGGTVQ